MIDEQRIYQRIGEFVVSFQWIENKLREIGWFVLDPERKQWPPVALRDLTNEKLVDQVHTLFLEAVAKCKLPDELERDLKVSFAWAAAALHKVRRSRNQILHSAFIELKAGGAVEGILRSDPKFGVDEDGAPLFNQELLSRDSFAAEMQAMAEVAHFLNGAYLQLIHRYPNGGIETI